MRSLIGQYRGMPIHPGMSMVRSDFAYALHVFEAVGETVEQILGPVQFAMPWETSLDIRSTPEQDELYDVFRAALEKRVPTIVEVEFIDYDDWDWPPEMDGSYVIQMMRHKLRREHQFHHLMQDKLFIDGGFTRSLLKRRVP